MHKKNFFVILCLLDTHKLTLPLNSNKAFCFESAQQNGPEIPCLVNLDATALVTLLVGLKKNSENGVFLLILYSVILKKQTPHS
jgi:hypothetical protein